jgi:hypothetical protein
MLVDKELLIYETGIKGIENTGCNLSKTQILRTLLLIVINASHQYISLLQP